MTITKIFGFPFLLCSTILVSHSAFAGFTITNAQAVVGGAPVEVAPPAADPAPVPVQPEQKLANSSSTPALQVFEERYVPDSVRKKYGLKDSWFGQGQPLTPMPLDAPLPIVENAVPQTSVPAVVIDSWRARKGENIRVVLQRWSERGHTDLMWASPDSPELKKDFSFIGKYQDAVNKLIESEGNGQIHSQYRSEGMSPVMMEPASTVTTNTPPLIDEPVEKPKAEVAQNPLSKIFVPEKQNDKKPETRWFGLSGAPLAEVIQVWADDAGVKLIWQSEKNFALKTTISQVGHFEEAVFKALSQYDQEQVRPVGEMYTDPKNGQTVLLVKTEVN